jgi:hypothetical protein
VKLKIRKPRGFRRGSPWASGGACVINRSACALVVSNNDLHSQIKNTQSTISDYFCSRQKSVSKLFHWGPFCKLNFLNFVPLSRLAFEFC